MDPAFVLLPVLSLATIGLIAAERKEARAWMWLLKPLASACFVALAFTDGPPGTTAGAWLVGALVLSFGGDVFLVSTRTAIFRIAILLFLVAHIAFVGAFLAFGIAWGYAAIALVPLGVAAIGIARWILPRVDAALKPAVISYMVVITAMVAAAAGAVAGGASPLLLIAAVAFWTNDILVARDRFVQRTWIHRLVGLPLYYGAMVLFALNVA